MIGSRRLFWKRNVAAGARQDVRKRNLFLFLNEASDRRADPFIAHIKGHLDENYNVICIAKKRRPPDAPQLAGSDHFVLADLRGKLPDHRIERLVAKFRPLYALAFGLENTDVVSMLEWRNIPVVMILTRLLEDNDLGALNKIVYTATKVAFPASLIHDAMTSSCPSLRPRHLAHLPLPALPAIAHARCETASNAIVPAADTPAPGEAPLLVVGYGALDFQGGLDLFVSAAAAFRISDSSPRKILFAWCGPPNTKDNAYLAFCLEQMRQTDLRILFVENADQLAAVQAGRRIGLLTSRLDIFPNAALSAAMRGMPVLCFARATSLARAFSDAKLDGLVVPYLDVDALFDRLQDLVRDQDAFHDVSRQAQAALSAALVTGTLAQAVDSLGLEAAALTMSFDDDYSTIKGSGLLDDDFYFGVEPRDEWRDATREHLHANRIADPVTRSEAGLLVRRPLPGFHPLVYASHQAKAGAKCHESALAHYIRAGSPSGPWQHKVLDMRAVAPAAPVGVRVAVHAHFHYPELLDDLLKRLDCNRTPVDLFLTTTSKERRDALDRQLRQADMSAVRIDIVPNVGRDVGPFVSLLKEDCLTGYDLVCHVHGKRSVQLAPGKGDTWRIFLWQNLIGGEIRALDIIAEAFAADAALGLVFPEENTLTGWDQNKAACQKLLDQIGMRAPLPDHFDFPVGTMFWARPAALEPLRQLDISWSDYPPEPIADDGTLLHALERIIPFCAAKAGFGYATTYVKGIAH